MSGIADFEMYRIANAVKEYRKTGSVKLPEEVINNINTAYDFLQDWDVKSEFKYTDDLKSMHLAIIDINIENDKNKVVSFLNAKKVIDPYALEYRRQINESAFGTLVYEIDGGQVNITILMEYVKAIDYYRETYSEKLTKEVIDIAVVNFQEIFDALFDAADIGYEMLAKIPTVFVNDTVEKYFNNLIFKINADIMSAADNAGLLSKFIHSP